jgi:exopolysaccharide biosynthesis protein
VSESNVVLAIVVGKQGVGLSLYEFAEFLRKPKKEGGAGCDAALNLDGGSSTQVCFSYKNTTVSIPGLWAINSAIVVRKKME